MRALFRLAVLVSGNGTTLQAIIDATRRGELPGIKIEVVLSNRPDAPALERAKKAGIETFVMNPKDFPIRSLWCSAMAKELKKRRVELVCLAGFLQKLEPCMVRSFPGKIINTHPALLPKFGGAGMWGKHVHTAVLKAGEKESGCTIHAVDEEYDHGAVLAQVRVPVFPNDTPETLAGRVQVEERKLYPQVIRMIAEGRIKMTEGHPEPSKQRDEGRLREGDLR
jgi:phosphoribosylglycinamide formyltransferase-1